MNGSYNRHHFIRTENIYAADRNANQEITYQSVRYRYDNENVKGWEAGSAYTHTFGKEHELAADYSYSSLEGLEDNQYATYSTDNATKDNTQIWQAYYQHLFRLTYHRAWGEHLKLDVGYELDALQTDLNYHVQNLEGNSSGHTATAFMTASMLVKEYGYKSPWIGIGAYSAATATGLMRMANNKHWLSDVLAGAGIGILSTEMGYYLADLIFKDKGIKRLVRDETYGRLDKPSFFQSLCRHEHPFFISPPNNRFRIGIALSLQPASIYGFHIKTVRFPYQERTVSIWRTYGFDIENVKVCLLKQRYRLHAKPNVH